MRKLKLASLILVMLLLLITISGCRCVPSSQEWHLYSYKKNVQFIGGVERELGFSSASVVYPFANADFSYAEISFTDDGRVSLCTWDGESFDGSYTFEHIGNYTRAYIELDNGEKIEADLMTDTSSKSKLTFKFRDVVYNYTNSAIDGAADLDEIIKSVQSGNASELYPASVVKGEGGFEVWFSEMVYYPIKEDTAVYAVKIAKDGSYSVLDEILEGEALSTYYNQADYVILYYVEE